MTQALGISFITLVLTVAAAIASFLTWKVIAGTRTRSAAALALYAGILFLPSLLIAKPDASSCVGRCANIGYIWTVLGIAAGLVGAGVSGMVWLWRHPDAFSRTQ